VWSIFRYLEPFRPDTWVWQMDRQTDRQVPDSAVLHGQKTKNLTCWLSDVLDKCLNSCIFYVSVCSTFLFGCILHFTCWCLCRKIMTMSKENFDNVKNWIRSTRRSVQNWDKPSRRVIMRLPYLEVGAYFSLTVIKQQSVTCTPVSCIMKYLIDWQ